MEIVLYLVGDVCSMEIGKKVKFLGREVVVLVEGKLEVLIQIERNNIRWIDKKLIDKSTSMLPNA
ncbi:MAG TPA: hypothetical protein VFD00_01285 [Thermoclostridium sp.]|nr:hypothetical protein [Thermoclostridium sp.]